MEPPGKLPEKRIVTWLVIALTLIAATALLLPNHFTLGLTRFVPLHTAMETFSIVVAMLVFTVGINTHQKKSAPTWRCCRALFWPSACSISVISFPMPVCRIS